MARCGRLNVAAQPEARAPAAADRNRGAISSPIGLRELVTGDPAGCADGIRQLAAMLGNPERWTFGQRLLLATHPTPAARLQRLADLASAGLPGVRPGWRT